jgi:hypothetical protein
VVFKHIDNFTLPVPCIVYGGGGGPHVHACVRGFIFVCLVIISVLPGIIIYPSNTKCLISLWCSCRFLCCGLDVLHTL